MIARCLLFNDIFCLRLNAKVKQIAYTDVKTMSFCWKFIEELFTKIFEATTLFWKIENGYPNINIIL